MPPDDCAGEGFAASLRLSVENRVGGEGAPSCAAVKAGKPWAINCLLNDPNKSKHEVWT